jgi:type II secretory pathway pseudopilin PulG
MRTSRQSEAGRETPGMKRERRAEGGFTMVEIALSLAIIGFALVAIIGILPAGMSVQKDNLEQTIINLDGAYLMNAIKSGARGQNDLTNYIISINQTNVTVVTSGKFPPNFGPNYVNQTVNILTYPNPLLQSASNIIGYLSVPKYAPYVPGSQGVQGFWSNSTVAVFRAINAPATDQGVSRSDQGFSFEYQVTVEVIPTGESPYEYTDRGQTNLMSPAYATNTPFASQALAEALQDNLYEIRLTYRWPVLPNGSVGNGKQIFRSSVAASYPYIYEPNNFNVPGQWLLQPQIYSATGVP